MSAIDCFRHDLIGGLGLEAQIPVYRFLGDTSLDQARLEYDCNRLMVGDILVGGGSGEHNEFIIHMQAVEKMLSPIDWDSDLVSIHDCFTNHWTMNEVVHASSLLSRDSFDYTQHQFPEWIITAVLNHLLKIRKQYPSLPDRCWDVYQNTDEWVMDPAGVFGIYFFLDFCPYVSRFEGLHTGHVAYQPLCPPNAVLMPHPWGRKQFAD